MSLRDRSNSRSSSSSNRLGKRQTRGSLAFRSHGRMANVSEGNFHSFLDCQNEGEEMFLQAVKSRWETDGINWTLARLSCFGVWSPLVYRTIPSLVLDGSAPNRPCVQSGIVLELRLLLEDQVVVVARGAFAQSCIVYQLYPFSDWGAVLMVTHAIFTTRLDYCNANYMELPLKRMQKLQLVQNAAARAHAISAPQTVLVTSLFPGPNPGAVFDF